LPLAAAFLVCSCCCVFICRLHLHFLNTSVRIRERVSEIICFPFGLIFCDMFSKIIQKMSTRFVFFKKRKLLFAVWCGVIFVERQRVFYFSVCQRFFVFF